jgi:hypothetical protein
MEIEDVVEWDDGSCMLMGIPRPELNRCRTKSREIE